MKRREKKIIPCDAEHSGFGVHISYDDLYNIIIFLTCIYVSGQIASRLSKMPDLVGEIVCGILLGPNLGKSCALWL
jgi:hypothetical protein